VILPLIDIRGLRYRYPDGTLALDDISFQLWPGETRRIGMAGVLAMQPGILVLDEPTKFLDPPGQKDLLELLRQLPQAKIIGEGKPSDVLQEFSWTPQSSTGGTMRPAPPGN
jgi:ABC-type multidrug transport system ATPase subunit